MFLLLEALFPVVNIENGDSAGGTTDYDIWLLEVLNEMHSVKFCFTLGILEHRKLSETVLGIPKSKLAVLGACDESALVRSEPNRCD